jgi:hypothetical protein
MKKREVVWTRKAQTALDQLYLESTSQPNSRPVVPFAFSAKKTVRVYYNERGVSNTQKEASLRFLQAVSYPGNCIHGLEPDLPFFSPAVEDLQLPPPARHKKGPVAGGADRSRVSPWQSVVSAPRLQRGS